MAKPGPKTTLDKELLKKLRESIVSGRSLKETAELCKMDEQKIYNWKCDNYLGLGDKIATWRLEAKLLKAEMRADEILSLQLTDAEGKTDSSITSIVQKESQFIRETLDKLNYSKRTEQTGKNGEAIEIKTTENKQSEDAINNFLEADDNTGNPKGEELSTEESLI